MMILKKINRVCGYVSGALIFISALVMLYDVICRYAFNAPSLYAPFIAAFVILGAIFIGGAYSFQAGGQVFVEIIIDKLRPLPRKICFTAGYLFSVFFLGALAKSCWDYLLKSIDGNWMAQGNLPIPSVILYGVMVAGLILFLITILVKIIEIWRQSDATPEAERKVQVR